MATCYRHPRIETGVSCSSCGRPICPDCMTPTSVGMRCPECSREKTRVVRRAYAGGEPIATYTLIATNALAFIASGAVFGLMGATVLVMRNRGINPMESGIGIWLGLNLLITFTVSNISIGGH